MPQLPFRRRRQARKELKHDLAALRDAVYNAPSSYFLENERRLGPCMAQALKRPSLETIYHEENGTDLDIFGLIVLEDHRGRKYVPIYQGGEEFCSPALDTNILLLEGGFSPCQVVNWWYTHHAQLGCEPTRLLDDINSSAYLQMAVRCTLEGR
jgi:hypothetical protein